MRHKKFLGIPVLAIAIGIAAVVACTGGGIILGQWLFTQNNAATVTIKGSGAALFKDQNCTVPLLATDTLAFGDVRAGSPTQSVRVWLKATGTDAVFAKVNQTGLDSALQLDEATYGVITGTNTNLFAAAVFAQVNTLFTNAVDAVTTTITCEADPTASASGYSIAQLGTELITYTGFDATAKTLTGVERGAFGTIAAAHPAHNLTGIGTVTGTPGLAAGAVLPLNFTIAAPGNLTGKLGNAVNFSINFVASSNY